MSRKFRILNQHQAYFITCSIIKWLDMFKEKEYRDIIIDSLKYCQKHKGLIIYAWCFMYDHIHLIIGTRNQPMHNILRDFKSYTSRHIRKEMYKHIQTTKIASMYHEMKNAGMMNNNNNDWQFWQQHNHPQELFSKKVADQKLNYIHYNPVKAGLIDDPKNWEYSSAIDYDGGKGLIDIEFLK
ncbi:REP-associated tyrosine transposase [Gracilimonas sp.]|uniref:REP-associated tyrosine transposase n=1 Tax=Gracilimonas sp. TaxID=1974203 RepID=UPI0037519937